MDEKIHADNGEGSTMCGNALRACSDDTTTDHSEDVNCWECRSML